MTTVSVKTQGRIATISLNRPTSLNALTLEDYEAFANALRDIDKMEDVLVTVWQGNGKWFCAGTDVKASSQRVSKLTQRDMFLNAVSAVNTDVTRALYTHSKILVAALNGPVMGIAAAFLGNFDFIYCLPHTWLQCPFIYLGLASEGGATVNFARRMGVATANDVLLWGKRKTAEDLLKCGFVNRIFPASSTEEFHTAVRESVEAELEGLDPVSLLTVKQLLRQVMREQNDMDSANLRESYAQAERMASGVPSKRFGQLARKEIKHKL